MRSLLVRLFDRPAAPPDAPGAARPVPEPFAPPAPARPLYAVGDIHGRADLVEPLLERIDDHAAASGENDIELVFLGDYIDRGPGSAEVLDTLSSLSRLYPGRVTCLMGNHERMMLKFLDNPAAGPRWFANGGIETLASFGMAGEALRRASAPEALAGISAALRKALPAGLEAWMKALPLSHRSGTVWAVHAGADPALPMERQGGRALLWGHPKFLGRPRSDGLWVVHGHTIVPAPWAMRGRIAVDTGAYRTGRLTAAAIFPGRPVEFIGARALSARAG